MADDRAPERQRPIDTLTCSKCQGTWQRERRVGPSPRLCPSCRVPVGTCADCGEGFELNKVGRRRTRCDSCRAGSDRETLTCSTCEKTWERVRLVGPKPRTCPSCPPIPPPCMDPEYRRAKRPSRTVEKRFTCKACSSEFTTRDRQHRDKVAPLCDSCSAQVGYCAACQSLKPRSDFSRQSKRRDGLAVWCKACMKRYNETQVDAVTRSARRHGITATQWWEMAASQEYRCAICKCVESEAGVKGFAIDHCHETGRIRGLLCGPCNTALGLFRDEPSRLHAAIDYLALHQGVITPATA